MNPNFTEIHDENVSYVEDAFPFKNFAPTLAQCYLIVSFGYALAKFGPLSQSDVRGVCSFASYFAMPAIICVSLADANFGDFHWQLLVGIIAGKAAIFITVAVTVICIKKPTDTTLAGIYAMFCVQCNDLPVGNPLMSSLYRFVRPHMMKYLFFLPSLTLIVFGPISHLLVDGIELSSNEIQDGKPKTLLLSRVTTVLRKLLRFINRDLLKSPVVIATVSGLMLNLIFKAKMPAVLRHPVHVLAETIPGIALSILGFNMIGRERYLLSSYIVTAFVLVFVKMVITPLVLHAVVKGLSSGIEVPTELCDFAFLYGIISPSSVIFAEASRKNVQTAIMGVTLLISSLTCFPLSYVIARLTIVRPTSWTAYAISIDFVSFIMSCISLACIVITLGLIWWKGMSKKLPHVFVECLIAFQVLIACAAIFPALINTKSGNSIEYFRLVTATFGEVGVGTWSAIIATSVVIHLKRQLMLRSSSCILFVLNCCFAALVSVIILVLKITDDGGVQPVHGCFASTADYITLCLTTCVLTLSVAVSSICIVMHYRYIRFTADDSKVAQISGNKFSAGNVFFTDSVQVKTQSIDKEDGCSQFDISKSSSMLCSDSEADRYYNEVATYQKERYEPFGPTWTPRTLDILVIQTMSIAPRLFRNLYVLFDCGENSVIVPLDYLQTILFFGQGIITFMVFGIDIRTLSFIVIKWFRALRYRKEKVEFIETEEQQTVNNWCSVFLSKHHFQCIRDLARERTWKGFHYSDSFWGHQMTQWLVSAGLASDLKEAEHVGQKLLLGGIIQHVQDAHNFHDAPYLYCFSKRSSYL